jgi:hypothetical protein
MVKKKRRTKVTKALNLKLAELREFTIIERGRITGGCIVAMNRY